MIKVAITGNIASGKSQVEKILLSLGYRIADTDKINHNILATDFIIIKKIKEIFKEDNILDINGNISREKLGKIIFSDSLKKANLEEILHKKINEKLEDFYAENTDKKVVFVSIPLLFETKQENKFDKIIFVSADEDIRLKRLIARNGYDENYAKKRISAQENETEKLKKSDYIIYNNSDLISLKKQVMNILNQLFL